MSTLPSVRGCPYQSSKPTTGPEIAAGVRRAEARKSVLIICLVAALLVAAFGPLVLPSSTGIQPEADPSTDWLAEEVLGQDFERQFAANPASPMPPIASPFQPGFSLPEENPALPARAEEEAKAPPPAAPMKLESRRALANCF